MRIVSIGREYAGSVLGLAVLTVALAYVAGPLGVAAGGVVAVTLGALPTPYAVAIGHLAVAFLVGPDLSLESLVAVEAGFGLLVASDAPTVRDGAAALCGFALLLALTQGLLATDTELWLAALVLVVAVSFLSYGLHRVERFKLGLAGGEP
ncbi:hypothetical protein [Haladaptatus sp. DYSN1]|uniref:hypothetical protein n=1 Tax=unclassified Haladaptatus TaxID=2622732 RepID=UPI0024049ECF|nr:hypothetical protein [Haladaptatus sp. DYSN1]